MKIQSLVTTATSPLQRGQRSRPTQETSADPQERVELSGAPALPAKVSTEGLSRQGSSWTRRLLGGLGLGLVALSLAGCNLDGIGGGNPPAPTPNQQQEQQVKAASYAERMDQLRNQSDKTGFYQMAEAGYQKALLEQFAKVTDPASKSVQEMAAKGLELFDFKGDPAAQQKIMREVMSAISQIKSEDQAISKYVQAAQTSLKVGQNMVNNAGQNGGLLASAKAAAFQEAMKQALTQFNQAPDLLKQQSGYDPAVVRNYVESLSMAPQIALDFGPQLKDDGLAATLYSETSTATYERIKADGNVLGSAVTTAMTVLENLSKGKLF